MADDTTGFKELEKAFKTITTKRAQKPMAHKALKAAARPVRDEARKNVPVRKPKEKRRDEHGRLVKTGSSSKKRGMLKRAVKIKVWKIKKRGLFAVAVQIGAGFFKGTTFYGAFQELGWRHGKRPGKGGDDNRKKIPGKFFLRDALKKNETRAVNTIARVLGKEIEARLKKT